MEQEKINEVFEVLGKNVTKRIISEPRAASLSNFAAYIAVFVAVGAEAEIVIADTKGFRGFKQSRFFCYKNFNNRSVS